MTRSPLLGLAPETLEAATGKAQSLLSGAKKAWVSTQHGWLHGQAASDPCRGSLDLRRLSQPVRFYADRAGNRVSDHQPRQWLHLLQSSTFNDHRQEIRGSVRSSCSHAGGRAAVGCPASGHHGVHQGHGRVVRQRGMRRCRCVPGGRLWRKALSTGQKKVVKPDAEPP
jgi:hypothetical protein